MSNKAVTHIGTLYAKPEHIDNLIQSFESLKQAAGYISHNCYRDIEDSNKLMLVEQWESKTVTWSNELIHPVKDIILN